MQLLSKSWRRKQACKPGSVLPWAYRVHPGERQPSIWASCYHEAQAAYPGVKRGGPPHPPLFGLAPDGVCRAPDRYRPGGGLLHHLFTLTPQMRGGLFSVALSVRHRTRALPGILPCGARTFLLLPEAAARPASIIILPDYDGFCS